MTVERTRSTDANLGDAWALVSDMAGYADHVSGLDTTEIVSGDGLGAVRRCVDTSGADWQETCVTWEPGSRFSVEVDVSSYPLKFRTLFSSFRGTWWVDEIDSRTTVGIRFEARLRRAARPLRAQITRRLERDLGDILASYSRSIPT